MFDWSASCLCWHQPQYSYVLHDVGTHLLRKLKILTSRLDLSGPFSKLSLRETPLHLETASNSWLIGIGDRKMGYIPCSSRWYSVLIGSQFSRITILDDCVEYSFVALSKLYKCILIFLSNESNLLLGLDTWWLDSKTSSGEEIVDDDIIWSDIYYVEPLTVMNLMAHRLTNPLQ